MSAFKKPLLERAPFGGPQLGILDTNTIFNDLIYQLRHERGDGLMVRSAREGALRLLASSHVYKEVYRRVPTQERRGFSAEQILALFEHSYLPQIRFVDVGGMSPDPRVLAVGDADPDDLPTAQLALLIAPCHVYTDDPDLTEAGFGNERNWLSLIRSAERTMQVDRTFLVAAELTKWGWRKVRPWLERNVREAGPVEVMLGGALGLAILTALRPAGQARLDQAVSGSGRFLAGAGELTARAGLGLAGERARHSGYLAGSLVPAQLMPTLEQQLARKLALEGPIETGELSAALSVEVGKVEALLSSRSCFVCERSGWSLGRRLLGEPHRRSASAG